ncbi:MAG: hypothetical protein U5L72_07965 [Bacteroidales bacterium]|nr:hypothetical protein [Bacteroidales bacterium]
MWKSITFLLIIFISIGSTFAQDKTSVPRFLSSGNAYATMFFEYYYMLQGDDIYPGRSEFAKNTTGDNAFSFRRVYLGYQHTFSERFSGKVQLEATDRTLLEGGQRGSFIKEANLRWKNIYPLADLIIGHSLTPVWSIEGSEFVWQYRSIERTIADMRRLRSSNDTGIRLKGSFNQSNTYGYNFMVGNGNSARAENDKYKLVYFNLWSKLFQNKLYLEIFQDYNEAAENRYIATTKGFVAWTTTSYTLAVELVRQIRGGFGADTDNIIIHGISIFTHANLVKDNLKVFGRLDSFNPDVYFTSNHYLADGVKPFDEMFYTFGLDFIPEKNIHVMPNIWVNSYRNKTDGQLNPKTEIVARLTFNVTFK